MTDERTTTRLTLENEHGRYEVEVPLTEMTVQEVFERLVCPVLYSTYHPESVDSVLREPR